MKKYIILVNLSFILISCSSVPDLSSKDMSRGDYLFNQKLKSEYTKFFVENVFKKGTYVFAGPSFLQFNNFQMIKLDGLGLSYTGIAVYTEEDGTRHEYTPLTPLPPYYGASSTENERKFKLEFSGRFKAFQQTVADKLNLIGTIKCKKDIKCQLVPDVDFALFKDPYDFSFNLEDEDKIISENVMLSNFSDYDATCIANRMIYIGMDQKAAELAIGKSSYSQGIAYTDVVFKDGKVSNFKFGNYNYDLHYFNRR